VIARRRFTRAELEAHRDATVPDLIGPGLRLLIAGINPGLWTAAAGAHFARPGNRFYPALFTAGIVDRLIDASSGYSPADEALLVARGIGITNLVTRATARADELTVEELRAGAQRLAATVAEHAPRVVAVLGVTAYRIATGERRAELGPQRLALGGVATWVVPNPSGLNAHHQLPALAAWYRQAAVAAGIDVGAVRDPRA